MTLIAADMKIDLENLETDFIFFRDNVGSDIGVSDNPFYSS